jgi:hypothetical protein
MRIRSITPAAVIPVCPFPRFSDLSAVCWSVEPFLDVTVIRRNASRYEQVGTWLYKGNLSTN